MSKRSKRICEHGFERDCPHCETDFWKDRSFKLMEALLLYHEAWNGAEGDWRTPMSVASKNATALLKRIRGS